MAFSQGTAQLIGFTTLASADGKTPTVPVSPVATLSKDAGAFEPATNTIVSIGGGACALTLAAAETLYGLVKVRVTSDNCDQVDLDVYFEGKYTAALADALEAGAGGLGANVVTVTVADGDGATYEGVQVSVSNDGGTTVGASGQTDSDGKVVFQVGSDDWRFTAAGNGMQGGGYTDVTVTADGDVTITVTAVALPEPGSDDLLALYNDETDDHGVALGAGDMTVVLEWVDEAGLNDAEALLSRSLLGEEFDTDATGRWTMNIPAAWATAGIEIRVRKTLNNLTQNTESVWVATLGEPDEGETNLNWAGLGPTLYE